MFAIETKELTKRYGKLLAVDHLNLQIKQGELFALLGINGAGKTTTVKMLSCLTRPTDGDAILLGRSIVQEPQNVKQVLAVSPQETALAPNLNVRENLAIMAGIYGISSEKIDETLKQFGLTALEKQKAKTLSGGWQRRLSIAMALISEPQILFLDEPTLGLDVLARSDLWNMIRQLRGKITVILTTHYMEEAEELADRIGVMKNGALCFIGTPQEMKTATDTQTVEQAFLRIVKEAQG